MNEHAPPHHSPLGAVAQSMITGYLDHAKGFRLPDVGSRHFWLGAAIGAGVVLLLRSRSSHGPDRPQGPPSAV